MADGNIFLCFKEWLILRVSDLWMLTGVWIVCGRDLEFAFEGRSHHQHHLWYRYCHSPCEVCSEVKLTFRGLQ